LRLNPVDPPPLFEFRAAYVEASGVTILDGVDAVIGSDGVTAVVGPSGSGKSTLLRLCNRLEVPTRGRVDFRGRDLAGLDPLAHRRRVGMVFQRPTPFPGTVRDNLRVGVPEAPEALMRATLERVHLPAEFLDRPADDLSGGESQRACLARALVMGPEVLLMDEPTSALDPEATAALESLARELVAGGVPVVWVSHDHAQVARIADRVLEMADGRVVAGATDGGPDGG